MENRSDVYTLVFLLNVIWQTNVFIILYLIKSNNFPLQKRMSACRMGFHTIKTFQSVDYSVLRKLVSLWACRPTVQINSNIMFKTCSLGLPSDTGKSFGQGNVSRHTRPSLSAQRHNQRKEMIPITSAIIPVILHIYLIIFHSDHDEQQ